MSAGQERSISNNHIQHQMIYLSLLCTQLYRNKHIGKTKYIDKQLAVLDYQTHDTHLNYLIELCWIWMDGIFLVWYCFSDKVDFDLWYTNLEIWVWAGVDWSWWMNKYHREEYLFKSITTELQRGKEKSDTNSYFSA